MARCLRVVPCWRSLLTRPRELVLPVEAKVRVVPSVLAGEVGVAEVARRAKVSEQSVGSWSARRVAIQCRFAGPADSRSGGATVGVNAPAGHRPSRELVGAVAVVEAASP
jgi:hypothetical protein